MTTKKDIEKKLEEQLDSLSKQIDKLEAKMKQDQVRASELEHQAMQKLISMRSKAKSELHHFKESGEEKWEALSTSLEQYWESLGKELKAYEGRL
jgi:chaperonin cofactor prefoldin